MLIFLVCRLSVNLLVCLLAVSFVFVCPFVCLSVQSLCIVHDKTIQRSEPPRIVILVFNGDFNNLTTTETSPPSLTVIADDDNNDARVTSPVDDVDVELATTQKKTRKKRRSSRKSEETGEEITTQQVDKGCGCRINYIN